MAIQFIDVDFVEVIEVVEVKKIEIEVGISTNKNHHRVRRTRLPGFNEGAEISTVLSDLFSFPR
jgi:hypothetical protein